MTTEDKLQYTVRKRHHSEPELPYSDCYDEFLGKNHTGRIVRLNVGKEPEVVAHLNDFENNIVKNEEDKVKNLIKELADIFGYTSNKTEEKSFLPPEIKFVKIIHVYGETVYQFEEDFSIEDYKQEIENKFGIGFVKEIKIYHGNLYNDSNM